MDKYTEPTVNRKRIMYNSKPETLLDIFGVAGYWVQIPDRQPLLLACERKKYILNCYVDKGGSVDVGQCNSIYTIIEPTPTTTSQTSPVSRQLLHLWPSLHKARQFERVA
jgi:hypothetical protein